MLVVAAWYPDTDVAEFFDGFSLSSWFLDDPIDTTILRNTTIPPSHKATSHTSTKVVVPLHC